MQLLYFITTVTSQIHSVRHHQHSLARARLSRSKERVWSNCILHFVQACHEILGVLIGLSTAVTYCGFPPSARESDARKSTRQQPLTFNVTSLMHNNESQYATAVDKPINMPRISWQACTKCSMQFDQTPSLLRESLARTRLPSAYGVQCSTERLVMYL